jgi:hypothetical protein
MIGAATRPLLMLRNQRNYLRRPTLLRGIRCCISLLSMFCMGFLNLESLIPDTHDDVHAHVSSEASANYTIDSHTGPTVPAHHTLPSHGTAPHPNQVDHCGHTHVSALFAISISLPPQALRHIQPDNADSTLLGIVRAPLTRPPIA